MSTFFIIKDTDIFDMLIAKRCFLFGYRFRFISKNIDFFIFGKRYLIKRQSNRENIVIH